MSLEGALNLAAMNQDTKRRRYRLDSDGSPSAQPDSVEGLDCGQNATCITFRRTCTNGHKINSLSPESIKQTPLRKRKASGATTKAV